MSSGDLAVPVGTLPPSIEQGTYMQARWRSLVLGAAVAAVAGTAACGSTSGSDTGTAAAAEVSATGAAPAPPTVYGEPVEPSREEPSDVAVDAPVTVAPGEPASVVITYAEWNPTDGVIEEGSFVQGVVETGGTCVLTLTRGATSVTASGPAEPDATTTSCGGLSVPGDQVSSGTWSAVVSYRSDRTEGTSPAVEVTVP